MSEARRVRVENVADGGLLYWLVRLYCFAAISLLSLSVYAAVGVYLHFARQVPPVPDLSDYGRTAPGVTTLVGLDGTLLAELATERREIVPLSRIPRPLIDAVLSTEDRRFFFHAGIDVRGMARALWANFRAGQVLQGESTITQQVAKAFLSSERTWSRKIKEAIFARRLEARYSKNEILALYLNHIFLGNGAYGVQAAARRYFDRDLSELDIGQMALIAGLPRGPSRYSPLVDDKGAIERRATVLDNMVETGTLARVDAEHWKQASTGVKQRRDYFHEVTPYFVEQVRRDAVRTLGQKAIYEGGYRIETTVLPYLDVVAQENVDFAVRKLDKRQGWRGPEAHLDESSAEVFRERVAALYGSDPLVEGRQYLGLVERVNGAGASVRIGKRVYPLPIENMSWAFRYSASDATNDKMILAATEAVRRNDVIWVKWAFQSKLERFSDFTYNEEGDAAWLPEQSEHRPPKTVSLALEQTPRVQAAIYTYDHDSGYVLAMTGGDDFDRSEFNRVTQACRQPGSAYKPIYYSLALDRGYAYDTIWNDKPKAEVDPITGQLWVPQNIDGSYNVQVTLERALVWSKNPPSVEIFKLMGTKDVEGWARRLGVSTPLVTSPKCEKEFCSSLALGASCVHLDEITDAFAVFARNGKPIRPVMIRRIVDRQGRVLEDHTVPGDPWLSAVDKLDRIAARAGETIEPVIDPRTAWLTSKLLREIVTVGHSGPIRATKVSAAGKTGTSSHTSDVWFIGYTSRWMTTAWIGDDTYQRQLGYKDASFMLSVPMWARYMVRAVGDQPLDEIPWDRPGGAVKGNDIGGPLKKNFPLPPAMVPPDETKPSAAPGAAPPPPSNLVRQKTIRVMGAPPRPLKPGEVAPMVAPEKPRSPNQTR